MALFDLTEWMDECSSPEYVWYVKRLSGNDTLANKSHQAGPYVPKPFLFELFPTLNTTQVKNPDIDLDLYIDSHADHKHVRWVYYNSHRHEKRTSTNRGRDETRITRLGGASSALLDPESTGALAIFAFQRDSDGTGKECHVWVCRHETEEDLVEDRIGPIQPGEWRLRDFGQPDLFDAKAHHSSCWLEPANIPPEWLINFPTGAEIISKTLELRPGNGIEIDERLIKRRNCEFEIFQSVEQAVALPRISQGFDSVNEFVTYAQSLLQRRKARSGRSLELHTKAIFVEENLNEAVDFQHQPNSEPGKRPDFLFPNQSCYQDTSFPVKNLRMLAVKTSCRDRWRQILNEADRIPQKHLLTLQEGVSENQFREMTQAGVKLVVPKPIISTYPKSVQPYLQTLESFIADIRLLSLS
ncbi:type II restriction endonuclease [Kordiimonas sp.]|uniref:type II restriction endonuclease n=1 Tax=Kordiimonas sp. TaxID=1970157 RepID=UPI003A922107